MHNIRKAISHKICCFLINKCFVCSLIEKKAALLFWKRYPDAALPPCSWLDSLTRLTDRTAAGFAVKLTRPCSSLCHLRETLHREKGGRFQTTHTLLATCLTGAPFLLEVPSEMRQPAATWAQRPRVSVRRRRSFKWRLDTRRGDSLNETLCCPFLEDHRDTYGAFSVSNNRAALDGTQIKNKKNVWSPQVPGREVDDNVRSRSFWKMMTGSTDGKIMVRRCLVTFKPFR